MHKVKTIFFDYDGTLHDSIHIYAPAFRKAYAFLTEKGLAAPRSWTDKEISYWLGFNPQDMWKNFMPSLDETWRIKCSQIISDEMISLIEQGKPILYDGASEMLEYLKSKNYILIFISNCKNYYKNCHNRLFKLDQYFHKLITSEDYNFIPKYDIIKMVKHNYPEEMVIIGDRKQDIEAGTKNNIYTIGCSYGFTQTDELEDADIMIDNILDLKKYL
nr:HAD hydrolase-like protein [Mobilitalea sibirica]